MRIAVAASGVHLLDTSIRPGEQGGPFPLPELPGMVADDVAVAMIGTGRTALELLGVDGRLLLFGWSAGEPTRLDAWDVVGRGITVMPAVGRKLLSRPGGLRELESRALAAAAEGELRPEVSSQFPLAKAADAHAALEARQTVGKVILVS